MGQMDHLGPQGEITAPGKCMMDHQISRMAAREESGEEFFPCALACER
jgi:hypothetical protein